MTAIFRFVFLILVVLIIISCAPEPKELLKEKQLKNYIKNELKIESKNNLLLFFFTGYFNGCIPCEKGATILVDSILRLKNLYGFKKYIIISDINKDSYIFNSSDGYQILIDSKYNLQKHGIDIPVNFIIEFNNNFELVYYEYLVSDNFKKVYKYCKKR